LVSLPDGIVHIVSGPPSEGCPSGRGEGAVRFSLGRTTTREDLEEVIRLLKEAA
jgi:hypothetical protein